MLRGFLAAGAAGVIALVVVTGAFSRESAPVTLKGTVGPGFTIKLTKAGKAVKKLQPGTYRFVVSDRSSIHNFVLERERGTERTLTSVGFTGTKTVTLKLTTGSWRFYCEPHKTAMRGTFTVGNVPADDHGNGG